MPPPLPPLLLPAVLCAGLLVLAGVRAMTLHVNLTKPAAIPVASVTVILTAQTASTTTLAAIVADVSGNQLLGRTVTWSSNDTSIAVVDASGYVTEGGTAGTATITATCEGITGTMTVTVSVPASVATTFAWEDPAPAFTAFGQTAYSRAVVKDQYGAVMTGYTITYTSGTPADVTVGSSTGLCTAVANGSSLITAQVTGTVGGIVNPSLTQTATVSQVAASVTVSPTTFSIYDGGASSTQQLTATVKDANSNTITGASVSWSSDAPSTATVNSSGLVTGQGPGTVHITATSGGVSGSSAGTVTSATTAQPVFTSITPSSLAQNTSITCAIVGDHLTADTELAGLPTGVSQSTLALTDAQHASVVLTAAGNAPIATGSVTLTNSNGTSGALSVSVTAGTPSGTSVSALHLVTTANTTHPSASQSVAIPAAFVAGKISGAISTWSKLDTAHGSSVVDGLVQATHSSPQALAFTGFVSPPLAAQIVPAMDVTFAYGLFSEAGDASSWYAAPVIYIYRPSTDAVVGFLHDAATGVGSVAHGSSTTSGKVATVTSPGSISVADGDVLVLEWWDVGGTSTFLHHQYNGSTALSEGSNYNTTGDATLGFASPIYLAPSPLGVVRVGPSGVSSSTNNPNIVNTVVATDADFRSLIPAANTSPIPLWDTSQTAKLGTGGSHVDGVNFLAAAKACDLVALDTTVTYTDRDSVTRNTLHVTIRPGGGAPLDPSKDALAGSSLTPELDFWLPNGRAWKNYYCRRVFRFKPGFSMTAPNNTASNTSGYNAGQSGAYKLGPHPENAGTRADLEMTGGQNPGSEYLTANGGTIGVRRDDGVLDANYTMGALSSIMPGWNTGGDFWELIRVLKIAPDNSMREKIWIGKLTDATVTLVANRTFTLNTASAWQGMSAFNVLGKNFNRQLASTDTAPEVWFGDTEFADPTESIFAWPAQIPVGDHF